MAAKQLVFSDIAREKVVAGVSRLAHAVRGTLGPKALAKLAGGVAVVKVGGPPSRR